MVLASAGVCWVGSLAIVISSQIGDLPNRWNRVLTFLLAAAVTLSLSLVIRKQVIEPRAAFRLGWDARERHDACMTSVTELDEQRRA